MVKEAKQEEKVAAKNNAKKDYISAVGRRRQAVARVRLYPDVKTDVFWGEQKVAKGEIFVNGKPIGEYFSGEVAKIVYQEPLKTIQGEDAFIITIAVSGGGKNGQLGAVVHGISRALTKHNKEHRGLLKKKGFLTRDSRARERRKVGMGGKARRKRQSPKR